MTPTITNKGVLAYYLLSFTLLASVVLLNHKAATFITMARVPRTGDLQPQTAEFEAEDQYPTTLIAPSRHPRNAAFTMEESVHYSLNSTLDWESLIPAGTGGTVRLGPNKRLYTVSMFHQLQCLDELRRAVAGTDKNESDELMSDRVHHCLNYIRQMLLCAASVRLEPVKPTEGGTGRGADGFWLEHRCRDWTLLRRKVENNSRH